MRRLKLLIICLCTGLMSNAQDVELLMKVMGVAEPSELDLSDVERLEDIYRRPVSVNKADRARLESSGLFTPYQIASLLDYIDRHGQVRSLTELSYIDGFNPSRIADISPFITLEERHSEGVGVPRSFFGDVAVRSGGKVYTDDAHAVWNYGMRFRISYGDRIESCGAVSRPYNAVGGSPTAYSAAVTWKHRYGKLIAGDFNARFGQGLCLWNSSFVSSLSSPSAFMKCPSGITSSYSFTGTSSLTGIASDASFGRWRLSAMLALPGLKQRNIYEFMPAVNLTRYGRFGHISMTQTVTFDRSRNGSYRIPVMMTSADASFCVKGVNMYGEIVWDWVGRKINAVAGAGMPVSDYFNVACRARYVPGINEVGMSLGGECRKDAHEGTFVMDALYHPNGKAGATGRCVQIKADALWIWSLSEHLRLKLRCIERVRTWGRHFRTEARADVSYDFGRWLVSARADVVRCAAAGALGYVETGYRCSALSVYLRCGLYDVDSWDDRIYVYERDAPGNFNVPAYYGKGWWTSAYMVWKFMKRGSLYLRASMKKPGNAELKFLLSFRF